MKRSTECDTYRARTGHPPGLMQDLIETVNTDRDYRYLQLRSDHADSGLKGSNFALPRHPSLGENEDTPALIRQIADVAKGGQSARLTLGDRKGIEKGCRQIIVQAISEAFALKMLM